MWITTLLRETESPTLSSENSNKLTHLGALFSFSFSLKYSITFFSQSGLTPFWAERKTDFSEPKGQELTCVQVTTSWSAATLGTREAVLLRGWVQHWPVLAWRRLSGANNLVETSHRMRYEATWTKHSALWKHFYTHFPLSNYPKMRRCSKKFFSIWE